MASRPRILLLFSGGLDSLLAARVLLEAGADVKALHLVTPFTGSMDKLTGEKHLEDWGIELVKIRINLGEFLPLLTDPAHGFGRALNPCIDCKILFLKKARQIMENEGFDAVATGEVLGERPMSQNRRSLEIIQREAGLQGRLLRPLSARFFEQTEVERIGLDRDKLLGIKGRGRKTQLALAEKWGIEDFATPAGGCLLTEPEYSQKLSDLLAHPAEVSEEAVYLLKIGRHFRFPKGAKLVVGREEAENHELLKHGGDDRVFLEVKGVGSPIGVVFTPDPSPDVLSRAAGIVARYSDARDNEKVKVTWWKEKGAEHVLTVNPLDPSEVERYRM